MNPTKNIVKAAFRKLGFDISRYRPDSLGIDPLSDIKRLIHNPAIIFDVGANTGQSVKNFKELIPQCEIHSFEPAAETFKLLVENTRSYEGVHLNNLAVGGSCGERSFLENSDSRMSSFLQPGEFCWGEVVNETPVKVTSLDKYCEEKEIPYISLLKTDTQGYDFEVIKGARQLIEQRRIQLIYMEVIFSEMYKDLPAFDEVYRFLLDKEFKLVSFYQFYHQRELASWSDALFRSTNFKP